MQLITWADIAPNFGHHADARFYEDNAHQADARYDADGRDRFAHVLPPKPRRPRGTTEDIAQAIRAMTQAFDEADAEALSRAAHQLEHALESGAQPPEGITRAKARQLAKDAHGFAMAIIDDLFADPTHQ